MRAIVEHLKRTGEITCNTGMAVLFLLGVVLISCEGGGRDENHATEEEREVTGVAGTYVLDEDAVRAAIKEWLSQNPLPPGVSREQMDRKIEASIDAQMAQSWMELVLKPGGTFVSTVKAGPETNESRGTWEVDRSKLKMVTTYESGKEVAEPAEVLADFRNGRITLSEKMEYPVVLERQSSGSGPGKAE